MAISFPVSMAMFPTSARTAVTPRSSIPWVLSSAMGLCRRCAPSCCQSCTRRCQSPTHPVLGSDIPSPCHGTWSYVDSGPSRGGGRTRAPSRRSGGRDWAPVLGLPLVPLARHLV
ncbi:hypothetical protein NP493_490g00003 [Ridgeia piscesae]|uniref:Uncharacterized protein n=1 Tax=Ridgeia piscesae TaxID=27915 RepID=A0AAD9NSY0_RIDPI|nr:hypothetical protein NP493_490g00003 [Ridgeia piscesae]